MFTFNAIVILALATCIAADPIRQTSVRRRVSARQQQLLPTPAPTGYPAAGVTPNIPFELPNETDRPFAAVTPQPDEVYGPPELNGQQPVDPRIVALQPDEVYDRPAQGEPDEVYGPPEIDNNPEIIREIAEDIDDELHEVVEELDDLDEEIIDGHDAVISVSSTFERPARLVYQRFPQSRQAPKAVPARLTKAKIVQPTNFYYTTRFQHL